MGPLTGEIGGVGVRGARTISGGSIGFSVGIGISVLVMAAKAAALGRVNTFSRIVKNCSDQQNEQKNRIPRNSAEKARSVSVLPVKTDHDGLAHHPDGSDSSVAARGRSCSPPLLERNHPTVLLARLLTNLCKAAPCPLSVLLDVSLSHPHTSTSYRWMHGRTSNCDCFHPSLLSVVIS